MNPVPERVISLCFTSCTHCTASTPTNTQTQQLCGSKFVLRTHTVLTNYLTAFSAHTTLCCSLTVITTVLTVLGTLGLDSHTVLTHTLATSLLNSIPYPPSAEPVFCTYHILLITTLVTVQVLDAERL